MSLAILGMGLATPVTQVNQEECASITRCLCCRTDEQRTWLPLLYKNSGIHTRHMAADPQVLEDLLHDTDHSDSIFLPRGHDDDRGPTTGQRMRYFAAAAGPLAVDAARKALLQSRLDSGEITHLITVSCTGMRSPGVDYDLIDSLGLPPTVQRIRERAAER